MLPGEVRSGQARNHALHIAEVCEGLLWCLGVVSVAPLESVSLGDKLLEGLFPLKYFFKVVLVDLRLCLHHNRKGGVGFVAVEDRIELSRYILASEYLKVLVQM